MIDVEISPNLIATTLTPIAAPSGARMTWDELFGRSNDVSLAAIPEGDTEAAGTSTAGGMRET